MFITGKISKIENKIDEFGKIDYFLFLDEKKIFLNNLLGKYISLEHIKNLIFCIGCQKKMKAWYRNNYCFLCNKKLAICDICIIKPEKCHFHLNTCREPEWGWKYCMNIHYVYLSITSGAKIGITKKKNLIFRWINQGAIQGLLIAKCLNRRIAGLYENYLTKYIADKTNWRKMLSNIINFSDLKEIRDQIIWRSQKSLFLQKFFNEKSILILKNEKIQNLIYPIINYPEKIQLFHFKKKLKISGILTGIKGQYLLFNNTVINLRKHLGYKIHFYQNSL